MTVTDSTGTSSTQNLVITITGTNDVPTITGDSTAAGTAVEAGGTNNGAPVTAEITGDASNGGANWTDLDRGEDSVLAITKGGTTPGSQPALTFTGPNNEASIVGTYGTLYIQANGQYRYVLNNLDVDTQALDAARTSRTCSIIPSATTPAAQATKPVPSLPSTSPARTITGARGHHAALVAVR